MPEVGIGLVGLGTIGSEVARRTKDSDYIAQRHGVRLSISKAYDSRPEALEQVPEALRAESVEGVITDPGTGIYVQLIGGTEPAGDYILDALGRGMHVVTANKALLAKRGREIFSTAQKNRRRVGFEASVCGGIPIMQILTANVDEIVSVTGILNGTDNYILTRMEELDSYLDSLEEAQAKGYAEADPSFDIEGYDAAQKLAIISNLAFGTDVTEKDIPTRGIRGVCPNDLRYAARIGDIPYKVKLIARARKTDGRLELGVHPTLVPQGHQLASVSGVTNAILIEGRHFHEQLYAGEGAGDKATADSVLRDIVEIAKYPNRGPDLPMASGVELMPPGDIKSAFYMRVSAVNKPGILSRISGITGDHDINIVRAIQEGSDVPRESADLVMQFSRGTKTENFDMAIRTIATYGGDIFPIVNEMPMTMRILDK